MSALEFEQRHHTALKDYWDNMTRKELRSEALAVAVTSREICSALVYGTAKLKINSQGLNTTQAGSPKMTHKADLEEAWDLHRRDLVARRLADQSLRAKLVEKYLTTAAKDAGLKMEQACYCPGQCCGDCSDLESEFVVTHPNMPWGEILVDRGLNYVEAKHAAGTSVDQLELRLNLPNKLTKKPFNKFFRVIKAYARN